MRAGTERIYEELRREMESCCRVDSIVPTELELCRRFGVGRTAVRTALSRLERDGLIRSRGFHGARLVSFPSRKMGKVYVIEQDDERFLQSEEALGVLAGISKAIIQCGGEIVPVFSDWDGTLRRICKNYSPDECSGVVFIEYNWHWPDELAKHGVPHIVANNETALGVASTSVDFRMVGRMACREFLCRGYRRCAMVGNASDYILSELSAGMRGGLAEERIEMRDDFVVPYDYYSTEPSAEAETRRRLVELLSSGDRPDSFLVFRYQRYNLLMDVIGEAGLRVPEDIGVIVYDALSTRYKEYARICLLQEPVEELGREAAGMLEKWDEIVDSLPVRRLIDPVFIERETLRKHEKVRFVFGRRQ